MSTELTAIEDSAAGIALQLTLQLMQDHALSTGVVVGTFNEIYWGVLEALNPDQWKSTESDARASQEGAERAAEPK